MQRSVPISQMIYMSSAHIFLGENTSSHCVNACRNDNADATGAVMSLVGAGRQSEPISPWSGDAFTIVPTETREHETQQVGPCVQVFQAVFGFYMMLNAAKINN